MKALGKWKRASLIASVVLALYTVAASARADSITVNSIGGGTNSFLGNFSMEWTAFGLGHTGFASSVDGSWDGGTWQFVFSTNPSNLGAPGDIQMSYTVRTFWNDGWIPGGLGYDYIAIGPVNSPGSIELLMFSGTPPLIATDYGPNGLLYYLTATATASNWVIASDQSGHITMDFNVSRVAVPESGGTLLLLLLASAVLIAGQIRARLRESAARLRP